MIVEIDLSDRAVRMLKSLSILTGKSSTELTEEVGVMFEDMLIEKIMAELDVNGRVVKTASNDVAPNTPPKRVVINRDVTGISDGLGDEDPEEPAEIPPSEDILPKTGGLSFKDIDEDMRVESPEIEAKVDAPTFGDDVLALQSQEGAAEELFGNMIGAGPYANPWADKRKRRPSQSKGKVSPLMGEPT